MTDPVVSSYPGGDGREIGEAMARGRFAPICDCGRKATHACSYCGGVCDHCIDHCEAFAHVWVVMS